jgi:hypothetical protein
LHGKIDPSGRVELLRGVDSRNRVHGVEDSARHRLREVRQDLSLGHGEADRASFWIEETRVDGDAPLGAQASMRDPCIARSTSPNDAFAVPNDQR